MGWDARSAGRRQAGRRQAGRRLIFRCTLRCSLSGVPPLTLYASPSLSPCTPRLPLSPTPFSSSSPSPPLSQQQSPQQVTLSTGLRPHTRSLLGRTHRTPSEVSAYLASISSRFSAHTYDLFANNCNHFSHALVVFLGLPGIPEDILRLPERVRASGPMGQQISQLWGSMSQQFVGRSGGGGTGDPFGGAFAASAYEDSTGAAGSASGAATASSAAAGPAAAPLPQSLLAELKVTLYSELQGVELVHARLKAGAGGEHCLSQPEEELLGRLGAALKEPSPAAWAPVACAAAARVLATFPPACAFPAAILVRLLAGREDCAAALTAEGGAAALLLQRYAATEAGWGSAAVHNQALQGLCTLLGGRAGRAWACSAPAAQQLAGVIARELGNATRADCRLLALALACNGVAAWEGVQGGSAEGHCQGGLPLLAALLRGVSGEGTGRRLQAATHLLRAGCFQGGDLGALALSVEGCAEGLQGVAAGGGEHAREAAAVLGLLREG